MNRLPCGSYRARLTVDGEAYSAVFMTEDEALDGLVVTRGRALGERAARTLTVGAYARCEFGEFIDTAAGIRYRRDVAEHILPLLGPRPLVDVTPTEFAALI